MSINHITLLGAVARAPEFRMTQNGIAQLSFQVAVTRPPRQDGGHEVTDYVRVIAWRQLAERIRDSVSKDDLVTIEGQLRTRSYETQDGQRRKTIEVEAMQVELVGAAKKSGGSRRRDDDGPSDDEWGAPPDDFGDLAAPPPPAPREGRKPCAHGFAGPRARPYPLPRLRLWSAGIRAGVR